jgi:CheY-like chemotaxis protein
MPKKLLLADDSVTIQRVIELTFAGEDVQVLTAGDGEEAISRIPVDKPDIILADIGMPKRSGYEVCAFVKGNPEFEKTPVLLLAGAFEPVDETKAKEARCDGVLVKPFEPHHVIARVRELIGGAKGTPMQAVPDIGRPAAVLAPPRPVELPKREERPAIPEDLMDIGEEDMLPREELLPHEDMLPQVDDVETASQPMVLDDSLDDYFDKLDEAFGTINSSARSSAPLPPVVELRPTRPDRPVLERDLESFDPPMTADPFAGIDAIEMEETASVPTLDDLLAGMPPAAEPANVIEFPTLPSPGTPPPLVVAPPSIEPPDVTPTLTPALPPPPRPQPLPPPLVPPPAPAAVAPPPPEPIAKEAASGRSIIADAFTALLAAEQGDTAAAPPRLAGNGSSPAVVTDAMVDDVAKRVIQKLALGSSDQMQSIVKQIVSDVAERLVREEIDRIRRNAPRS